MDFRKSLLWDTNIQESPTRGGAICWRLGGTTTSSSMALAWSGVRLSAAWGDPVAFIDAIHLRTVDLPRSHSAMISLMGLSALHSSTICRLKPSLKCRGFLGSAMAFSVRNGPHGTVQLSVANPSGGAGRIRRIVKQAVPGAVACEDRAVRLLAQRISENAAEIESLASEISALLSADETHRCLLTVPGIGPRTASELAISIDIADFASHDRLASYCGLAPRNRRSGTSISSVSASQQGNKRLKNLLVFSCNCLARSRNRWGDYHARCRGRGAVRQGAESRGEKAAQGDLRDHEGQGSVRSLTACVSIAKNAHRKDESPLTKL